MKKLLLLSLILLLSACGSGFSGKYSDANGMISYTFQPNGKVTQSGMGMEVEFDYKKEGDKVKMQTPQGTIVFTVQPDGSMTGLLGMKFVKQDK